MAAIIRNDQGKLDAFAWPGGYPIVYYNADDAEMCPACANGENGSEASETSDDKQWRLVACDVYWEGPPLQCSHCNEDIESAYGDPDEVK